MSKRRAIGANPLDGLLSDTPAAPRSTRTAPSSRPRPAAPAREKVSYLLPADVVGRARNTSVALSGPPHRLTLAALVSSAITRECERLERAHNGGKPFPQFGAPLVGGRPIKVR